MPGVRLFERPGALHFFDGRRVVSIAGDHTGRDVVGRVLGHARPTEGTDTQGDTDTHGGGNPQADDSQAVALLSSYGLTTDSAPDPSGAADFCAATVSGFTDPDLAARRIGATTVHVWESAPHDVAALATASGLTTQVLGGQDELDGLDPLTSLLLVVADPQHPGDRLHAANDHCLRTGVPWLPVGAFDGAVIRVGPLMLPGQTACAQCLTRRLAANVGYLDLHAEVSRLAAAPTVTAARTWAHACAVLTALLWIATRDPDVPGRLLTLEPLTMQTRSARVFRVPRCASCSAPGFLSAQAPWSAGHDH